ncbi:MAG TPA: hypothetical protein PLJ35_09615 [Anaerolineae bacterium]|nr:hypothetical protein [Anaerolineae bacterium]HOQ99067.1 hypothetical protein [Anaerolineae bacterium]
MTGQLLLDWAVLAASFFNMILVLWLGLTVLLNAERRSWGLWLAVGGMLAAAAFLVIHSALYTYGWARVSLGLRLSWSVGWMLVVALPCSWYLMVLWYAGYWDDAASHLHRRQRPWLALVVLAALGLLLLLALANPFPPYERIVDYETAGAAPLGAIPIAGLAYPLYILACIALSVDVLLRPAPSGRMMGDLARRRARPWLVATTLALLAVSGLVGLVVTWLLVYSRQGMGSDLLARMATTVGWFDLAISALLTAAILLLGQAVVSYEIFTGQTLPRRGLRRQWQSVVLLGAGFGLLAGGTLTGGIRPVNGLLLVGALVALFLALQGRQSFVQRERSMEHLRPLVASLGLHEHLLAGRLSRAPAVDVAAALRALAVDVLGARVAYLAALGPLAPLARPVASHPDRAAPLPSLRSLAAQCASPLVLCLPLDPAAYGGAAWAVPLWSGRGLVGVLLLGEKEDGALYTQEEMEIARASSERLLDTQAAAEMARRLMALQRQRLAESRVLDWAARRTLHDDILPRLHAAILDLSGAQPASEAAGRTVTLLAEAHRRVSDLLRELPAQPVPALAQLGLCGALRQAVAGELAGAFDAVTWQVDAEAERLVRGLPLWAAEVLFFAAREALRNAARYGRGGDAGRPLHLRIEVRRREGLEVCIEDDGVGLEAAGREAGGSGQGLALHSTMMAVIGGALAIESLERGGMRVSLLLPEEACAA